MIFGRPSALLLLWALMVVYALHRRRRARRELPIPSLEFLPATAKEGGAAGPGPREALLLLVRWLICSAVILALAQPDCQGGSRTLAVVVDTSASMAATDPGQPEKSRLQVAKAAAIAAIEESRASSILLLSASPRVQSLGGWMGPEAATSRLEAMVPGDGAAMLSDAVEEARTLAEEVRVFSDAGARIPDNIAISVFSFRPHAFVVERGTFLVELRGPSGDAFVHIDSGGRSVGQLRILIGHDGVGVGSLEYMGSGGAPARAVLQTPDTLERDNTAFTGVPKLLRRKVAVVTPGNEALVRSLRAWPRGKVSVSPPRQHPRADLLILDGESGFAPDRAAVTVGVGDRSPAPTTLLAEPDATAFSLTFGAFLTDWRPLPPPPAGAEIWARGSGGEVLAWLRPGPGPARGALAFYPSSAASDPRQAVMWAEYLEHLMVPDDGGCAAVGVGQETSDGPLARVGLYRLKEGCYAAHVPTVESFPDGAEGLPSSASVEGTRSSRPMDLFLVVLAMVLLFIEAWLAGRSWRGAS